jgi:hypothetical protein
MVGMLRKAGFVVHPIYEVWPSPRHQFIADPEWISLCGEKNWIVVTGDKRIETVPENRQAVIDAKAKVFLVNDSNSYPEEWAAAVIVGHYKMQEIIDGNRGPFFVNIRKRADGHIAKLRLPYGYLSPQTTAQTIVSETTQADGHTSSLTLSTPENESAANPEGPLPSKPGNLFGSGT